MNSEKDFYQEIEDDLRRYLMEDCLFLEDNDPTEEKSEEETKKNEPEDVSKEEMKQFAKDFGNIAKKKALVIKGKAMKLVEKMKTQKMSDQALIALPNELSTLTKATVSIGASTILLGNPLIGMIGFVTSKYLTGGVKNNKRLDLIAKYNGEIKVVDAKLAELDAVGELNAEQKKQKYELLRIKETYRLNISKLNAQLK